MDKAVSVRATASETRARGRSFTFTGDDAEIWTAGKPGSSCTIRDGVLVLDAPVPDAITSPGNLGIDGTSTDTIVLRMRVAGSDKVFLSWRARGGSWSENYRMAVVHVVDAEKPVAYQIRVSSVIGWRQRTIDQLRLTLEKPGALELTGVTLVTEHAWLAGKPAGVGEFTIDGSIRSCLYVHCPGSVEYDVAVPERAVFSAGLGLMSASPPVTFALSVTENGNAKTVFSRQVAAGQAWADVSADLTEYAGRKVRVTLRAECETPGGVALWSNPCIYEARRAPSRWRRGSAGPPNVVLYIIDALRADHLPAYGYGRDTAPNLTAFARRAALFTHCFSQDTWTQPSIASLMTGVDSLVHGNVRYGEVLPDTLTVLPEILRRAGYTTAAISENLHNPPHMNPRSAFSMVETPYLRRDARGDQLELNMAWGELSETTYAMAAAFLESHADRPFFLCLHTMECHYAPPTREIPVPHYDPPEPFRTMFASSDGFSPMGMDTYDGAIRYADVHFQRILDKIKALGLDGNTLVIVTADHGEGFDRARWIGHNGIPFIELVHVPLIMCWPDVLPAGKRIEENVQLLDLAPSILDFLGLPQEAQFQGLSVVPLIERTKTDAFADRIAFSYWNGHISAVQGSWKLTADPKKNVKRLFNLEQDPGETRDAARENPAMFQSLGAAIQAHLEDTAWADKIRREATQRVLDFDPQTEEMLRALGYLGE